MNIMTAVYFGVMVFALCLSTQVNSQNATDATPMANQTTSEGVNVTTMATNTYSSAANGTSPTGAGPALSPASLLILIPIAMATSLLHHCC
ncbi:hypothetical protein AGOR_G00132870 [Albula goreensis]|uniref:Uncharacterized protein n=2 Tax=Albula TaxID=54908 RepID=A0A8T3D8D0_9TELE|nr:hypothetical protein JZ751_023308 [Albula glossodonta]KAI1892390.1 hypothetical protein AGOR_G00132870 [Albula goreensis]